MEVSNITKSRSSNTMKNSVVGIFVYIVNAVVSMVSRTIFIKIMGVEYLGVNGLYSNILTMLSLTDMGLFTVMMYSLYKPLAENDTERISSLIRYFNKLYNIIACIVALLGVAFIPILPYIVNNSSLEYGELIKYYLLILANNVCSYFAISKTTLIKADQQVSIIQTVTSVNNILMHIVQIVLLLLIKSYTVYLIVPVVITIINNLILSAITTRKYPYLRKKNDIPVDNEIKVYIKNNLKSTFVYKAGASIINYTDNILISILLGTVIIGYYTNYLTIVKFVNAIISILIQAVIASLGNYNSSQSSESKYSMFKLLLIIFYGLAAFCAASYFCVFSDFIALWIGEEYILNNLFLISLVFSEFVACISNPIWMTRETTGLFKEVRYVLLITAFINIVLSVILGKWIGLPGIIFATGISKLVTMFLYEPHILCKRIFNISSAKYWCFVAVLLCACILPVLAGILLQRIQTENILIMLLKVLACAVITTLSFTAFFFKSEELKRIKKTGLNVVLKIKNAKKI